MLTQRSPRRAAGFTLVELMVTIALIAILLVMVVPGFGTWNADARTRSVAESLTNAIRQTQSAAVAQGRTSLFALTADAAPVVTSLPAQNASNWMGVLNHLGGSDETATLLIKSTEAGTNKVTITGPAMICFNSLGRETTIAPANNDLATQCTAVDPTTAAPYTYKVSRTAASRSYNILVYAGGRVRMCDAAKTLSSTNPDGC